MGVQVPRKPGDVLSCISLLDLSLIFFLLSSPSPPSSCSSSSSTSSSPSSYFSHHYLLGCSADFTRALPIEYNMTAAINVEDVLSKLDIVEKTSLLAGTYHFLALQILPNIPC